MRDTSQIVEQQGHVMQLARDHLAPPQQLGFFNPGGFKQFQRISDGRQRISQLMREDGQELVFAPVGMTQLLLSRIACCDKWGAIRSIFP